MAATKEMETYPLSHILEALRDAMHKLRSMPEEEACPRCIFRGGCFYPKENGDALCIAAAEKLENEGLV